MSSFLGSSSSPNLGGGTWGGGWGGQHLLHLSQHVPGQVCLSRLLPCVLETCVSQQASQLRGAPGTRWGVARSTCQHRVLMVGATQHRAMPTRVPYGHAEPSQVRQDPWLYSGKAKEALEGGF